MGTLRSRTCSVEPWQFEGREYALFQQRSLPSCCNRCFARLHTFAVRLLESSEASQRRVSPRQVSKSALFAVGAPHTWPGLLAALAWLVEMLSYEEKAAVSRAASFDDRARLASSSMA